MAHVLKIETAGIQRYIFGSNKLKVNLGASYIIEHLLYKDVLGEAIEEVSVGSATIIDDWFRDLPNTEERDFSPLKSNEIEVAYIGGGNAVLLGNEATLNQVNQVFKIKVLQYFPGMEVYSGLCEAKDYDKVEGYRKTNNEVAQCVNSNRSQRPFINKTLNHGFYNKCRYSGNVASHKINEGEEKDIWVSDEIFSKIQYGKKEHDANIQHELDLLSVNERELYTFPIEFEDFSAKDNKKYIAIVHIDGNNLGKEFINSKDLKDTRKLSLNTRKLGTEALRRTINEGIIAKLKDKVDYESLSNEKSIFEIGGVELKMTSDKKVNSHGSENYKLHLPIRPIITGGDDITFVCEGTLGVPLAKLFLEKFNEVGKELNILNGDVHACAGVAIVKQKYPFYRAYQLSEELIKEAKKPSRDQNGSYLSFMIAGYGTGTSLEDLRDKYAKPELYYDTFRVLDNDNVSGFHKIEKLITMFNKEKNGKFKVPRNKLMNVRHSLVNGDIKQIYPIVKSRINIKDEEWNPITDSKTSFEAIELLDFYNKSFLNLEENETK